MTIPDRKRGPGLGNTKNTYDGMSKKERRRLLNEPPRLTVLEEVGNAVNHGVGALLSIAGFVLLLLRSHTSRQIMAACFYGISLILLFLMSCLYHSWKAGSTVKRLWRRFDYCSIYLLIGGTYAPLLLVYWQHPLGIWLFWAQWAVIAAGITFNGIFGPGRLQALNMSLYFAVGWLAIGFLPGMLRGNFPLFCFILGGGVVYTLGMIPFARNFKGAHFLWHFFVLAGALIHWFGIYFFLY